MGCIPSKAAAEASTKERDSVRGRSKKPAYTIGMHDDSPADTVHGGNALLYMMTEGCGEASGRWKTKSGVPPVFEMRGVTEEYTHRLLDNTRATWPVHACCDARPLEPPPANTPKGAPTRMEYSLALQQGRRVVCQDSVMAWPTFLSSESLMKRTLSASDLADLSQGGPATPGGSNTTSRFAPTAATGEAAQKRRSVDGKPAHQYQVPVLAVYDGHGQLGHHISQIVRDLVSLKLHDAATAALAAGLTIDWPAALSRAYVETDKEVLELRGQQKASGGRVLDSRFAGTTGTTAVLDGLQLHIASVGDSRVILGKLNEKTGAVVGVTASYRHLPTDQEELERITNAGGCVRSVPTEPHRKRLWPGDVQDAIDGLCELSSPGLCMSRAFGDSVLKQCGLIVQPHAFSVPLEPRSTYVLVLASDGVWDVLSNQSALTVAAAAPPGVTPAQHLTDVASQSWKQLFPQSPMDDIGVAVGIIHTCK